MTHLLVVAYHFPPVGGAGAQRPLRLAGHLAELGYRTTVITGPGPGRGRWTPEDPVLGAEIPAGLDVRRLQQPEPSPGSRWSARADRWLMRRTQWSRWWTDGVREEGLRTTGVDAVYAYMSPYESAEAAARLARKLGRPWVADLGDPWALDEMMIFPTELHRRREIARMRHWLGLADGIVMSTPEAVLRLRQAFPEFAGKPMTCVPNGYEGSDFEADVRPREDGVFRIVHTGYLHTALGQKQLRGSLARRIIGGQARGVNILSRSHIYLLQAVDRLLAADPSLESRLEVVFAGVLSEADRAVGARSPVTRLLGYVPHDVSTELVRTADLLFLPMQDLPPSTNATIVPGKTYEYLASGRPILAAVPKGDVREILERAGTAKICDPTDVDAIASRIAEAMDSKARGEEAVPDADFIEGFEYSALARRVAGFLPEVLESTSQQPPTTLPIGGRRSSSQAREGKRVASSRLRILYLAYYFPPIGGAGAQRSLKFVHHLPEFGIDPIVVTGTGATRSRWSPADQTLLADVPDSIEIRNVPGPEPASSSGARQRSERWLGIRSEWDRWWIDGAVAVGSSIDADVIHASMSPYGSAEAAARLAERLEIPWVAELRDPWALDEMLILPTRLHRRHELARMERALSSAAAIVMNTKEAAQRVRDTFPSIDRSRITWIPNGYEPADFEGPVDDRSADTAFRIVHAGYLHTELGRQQHRMALKTRLLGGAIPGVDILTRSHVYLLQAVERVIARNPGIEIKVDLAGHLSAADLAVATDFPFVRVHGYLDHAHSVALVRSADLLFLPMHDLPAGTRATVVPGKTYEYLGAQRPILGAVPAGDAYDLLAASGTARLCAPADIAGMAEAIEAEHARWRRGEPDPRPNPDVLARFERKKLTGDLADVFRSVVDGRGRLLETG
jgi:glycosyltransferase involved in cell wall biosynthesis